MEKSNGLIEFKNICEEFSVKAIRLNDRADHALKAYLAVNLFLSHLEIFPTDQEPTAPMIKKFKDAIHTLDYTNDTDFSVNLYPQKLKASPLYDKNQKESFEQELSSLFASVWMA